MTARYRATAAGNRWHVIDDYTHACVVGELTAQVAAMELAWAFNQGATTYEEALQACIRRNRGDKPAWATVEDILRLAG